MTNKERFIELLRSTKREGIEKLIDFLEKTDFFTAPASTRFHSSYEGGDCCSIRSMFTTAWLASEPRPEMFRNSRLQA